MQAAETKEELEEKQRNVQDLEEERGSLTHQLQLALARADSEALARSVAEETVAELEKEKTMKELELKDLLVKHRTDQAGKEQTLNMVSFRPEFIFWRFIRFLNLMILLFYSSKKEKLILRDNWSRFLKNVKKWAGSYVTFKKI